jgi:HlyD family secretion protein
MAMLHKRGWVYTALGVAGAVALLAWAFAPRPVEVEVAAVTRGPFETTVDEDAKTRLRERYVVSAPLAGLLSRIGLREGDAVQAHAVVATLAPALSPMLDARTLQEQRVRVEIAAAQVQRAAARTERARVALLQAGNDVRRSVQLAAEGFVAPTRLEADRLAALAAQKEFDAAREEAHVAGHEVEQARAALAAVQQPDRSAARAFALRAPIAGRVLRVLQPSEAALAVGTPILEIGDTAALEVVAELLTGDALRTPPGSRVRIERWGGDGVLEGRVARVEPAAFTKVSALGVEEQRVRVVIDIESPAERWRSLGDGFRVGVRIVTLAVGDAVKVPVSAVFPRATAAQQGNGGADGAMAVFAVEAGRARLRAVQVGARNGNEAWLQGGLAPGAVVIVYPPATVRDGARVKLRQVAGPA